MRAADVMTRNVVSVSPKTPDRQVGRAQRLPTDGEEEAREIRAQAKPSEMMLGCGKISRQVERLGGAQHCLRKLFHSAHFELPNPLARHVKTFAL